MHTGAEGAERKGYLNVVVKDEYRKPQRFYETTLKDSLKAYVKNMCTL